MMMTYIINENHETKKGKERNKEEKKIKAKF